MKKRNNLILVIISFGSFIFFHANQLMSQEVRPESVKTAEQLVDIGDISRAIAYVQKLMEKNIVPAKATLAIKVRESKIPETAQLEKFIKSGNLASAINLIESIARQDRSSAAVTLIEKLVRDADLEQLSAEKVSQLQQLSQQDKIPKIETSLGYNELDLSNLDLESLDGISKLEVQIDADKKPIGNVQKLILKLNNNDLERLPSEIGFLGNLVWLEAKKNKIKDIPEEIGKLSKLTVLDLEDNKIEKLPKNMVKLTNLTQLNLDNNENEELSEIDNYLDLKAYLGRQ